MMIHPREALIVAQSAKAQAKLDNPNVAVLSPGDPVVGHRFDRIVVKVKLVGEDAEWRSELASRAVLGCKWTKK